MILVSIGNKLAKQRAQQIQNGSTVPSSPPQQGRLKSILNYTSHFTNLLATQVSSPKPPAPEESGSLPQSEPVTQDKKLAQIEKSLIRIQVAFSTLTSAGEETIAGMSEDTYERLQAAPYTEGEAIKQLYQDRVAELLEDSQEAAELAQKAALKNVHNKKMKSGIGGFLMGAILGYPFVGLAARFFINTILPIFRNWMDN